MNFLNNLRTFCVISWTISVNLGTSVKIQDRLCVQIVEIKK